MSKASFLDPTTRLALRAFSSDLVWFLAWLVNRQVFVEHRASG
jgi:hypothetical protein